MDLRPFKRFVRWYWVGRAVCAAALICLWHDVVANNGWKFLIDYILLCWWVGTLVNDAQAYRFAKWALRSEQVAEDLE